MTVSVDDARILDRVSTRRQQGMNGIDLWVELEGIERPAGAVLSALNGVADGSEKWEVQPTTGGAWVWLDDAADVTRRVSDLAAALARHGHEGSITVPRVDPWLARTSDVPVPSGYLVHEVAPAAGAGPFNAHGVPEPRWGVREDTGAQLLERAVSWVLTSGTRAHVGDVLRVPVQEGDGTSLIRPLLDKRHSNFSLASTTEDGQISRSVSFSTFGQTWWADIDARAHPLAIVRDREQQLIEVASVLLFGAVHATFPDTDEREALTTSVWRRHPHLWSSFAPDAFGLQLLSGRHLERAHDLSDWDVRKVASDRWLVSTHDREAWFNPPAPADVRNRSFPDPALRAKARQDFGSMILSRDSPEARRRQP